VFGKFLGVAEQIPGQRFVFLAGFAARAGAGDGAHGDGVGRQLHEDFRRGADDVMIAHVVVKHVRRRVEGAQRPVQRQRRGGIGLAHAL
jgi:hypothetical protein